MSDPIYQGLSAGYFTCDRDPTSNEPIINAIPFPTPWITLWWNQTSENLFYCNDPTQLSLVWHLLVSDSNINISRSYSLRSSPSFNTSYQPSITNDTLLISVLSLTSTALLAGTVQVQIDTGSGFNIIGEASISGLDATNIQTINCLIPSGAHYKLVNSSGTSSIISVNEIQL